jgi:FKBP-type peptidyl-prolyl cis-trans isomerase
MRLPPRRDRRSLLLAIAMALSLGALLVQAQQPPAGTAPGSAAGATAKKPAASAGNTAAASEKDAVSYSLGVSMGEQLRSNGITPEQISGQRLAQGVHDGVVGKAKMTDADRQNISRLMRSALEGAADANHRAAAKFLAENGKKPGVTTTASGLQYQVLTAGSGESPKATDEVTVNYRGTLLDGTEFDSSYRRGEPATFPLARVIPGWTEGLQLMKPGAKYQLFVPPQLAYDMRPRPGIPPGSMLIFEVELLSVKSMQPASGTLPLPAPPAGQSTVTAPPPTAGSSPPK